MNFSVFIFLSVMSLAFGYIAGNTQKLGFWKIVLLCLLLIPFAVELNWGKAHLLTMLITFIIGYLLPHARGLEGLGEALSRVINSFRYKDAYEEIKRKEAEVEALRRQYEQAQREANQDEQEEARERRRKQSRQHRQSQQGENGNPNHNHNHKQKTKDYSVDDHPLRRHYLSILGLDPYKHYSYQDIKKAYRRQAKQYHPDKHHHKGKNTWQEMNERFREIKEAYEWLGVYEG